MSDIVLGGTEREATRLLEACRSTQPELLVIDVELASRDDFALISELTETLPNLVIAIAAPEDDRGLAARGLGRGAFELLPLDPTSEDDPALRAALQSAVSEIERRENTQRRHLDPPSAHGDEKAARPASSKPAYDLVLIACSTGGPNALRELIPQIPRDFPVPVLAVQHMPDGYLPPMVEQLSSLGRISVSMATHRMKLPATGWVFARPGWHLELRANRSSGDGYYLKETTQEPVHGCRPSADVLFESVAKWFDGNVLSVVMTGMGRDGCDGVRALRESRGGYCLIQDESSSVVYGMPRAVERAGLADEILPLGELPQRMAALVCPEWQ